MSLAATHAASLARARKGAVVFPKDAHTLPGLTQRATVPKEVGLRIAERSAKVNDGQRWLKRSYMEMGGKDALIVDEGQDFQPDWWDCVKGLLTDPDQGIWYVFYDPVQDIYGGAAPEALDNAPQPLVHNCRNTKNIAAFCGEISGTAIHPYPSAPVGVEVEQIECANGGQAVTQVGALFERLIS